MFLILLIFLPQINAQWTSPIPYYINKNIVHPDKIMTAIDYIQEHTNWEFKQRNNETDIAYIHFQDSDNYSADLGWHNKSVSCNIASYCSIGTIIHEICHNLGLPHQQQYPNRNNYINITQNIIKDKLSNFNKLTEQQMINFSRNDKILDYKYDLGSIMHYNFWLFSKNGKKTITINNPYNISTCAIGTWFELSDIDIKKLNDICIGCPNTMKPKKQYLQYCGGLYINAKGNIFGNYENNKQIWGDHRIRYRWSLIMKNRLEIYKRWYLWEIYMYDIVRAYSEDDGETWYVNGHVDESNKINGDLDKSFGIHILEIYLYAIVFIFFCILVYIIKKAIFLILFFGALWFGLKFTFY